MSDPLHRNSRTSPSQHPIDDASREQCMRYLLGSMEAHEAVHFQSRLKSETAMGDELVAQADLICHLAIDEIALSGSPVTTNLSSRHRNITSWVRWAAAIAASLLIGFLVWSQLDDQQQRVAKQITATETIVDHGLSETDEELLIAQAWADGPLSLALASLAADADIETFDESDTELDSLEPNEESVLNWMMVAVNAGANHEG